MGWGVVATLNLHTWLVCGGAGRNSWPVHNEQRGCEILMAFPFYIPDLFTWWTCKKHHRRYSYLAILMPYNCDCSTFRDGRHGFILYPVGLMDDVKAWCKSCLAPVDIMTHLISAGFTTIALLGHSISDVQEILDFIESLKLETALQSYRQILSHLQGQL